MAESAHSVVILVVEDELFVRMTAVDVLIERGMTVLEAGCVEEALEVIQAEARIDLLFTDINMPGDLDGLDLAEIAHRRQPDLKLIVTSGAMNMTADDVPDHGVFIPKPYDTRALANWWKPSCPHLANEGVASTANLALRGTALCQDYAHRL